MAKSGRPVLDLELTLAHLLGRQVQSQADLLHVLAPRINLTTSSCKTRALQAGFADLPYAPIDCPHLAGIGASPFQLGGDGELLPARNWAIGDTCRTSFLQARS